MNWQQLIQQIVLVYLFTPSAEARVQLLKDASKYPESVRIELARRLNFLLEKLDIQHRITPTEFGLLEALSSSSIQGLMDTIEKGEKVASNIINAIDKFRNSDSFRAIMEKCASGKGNIEFCKMFLKFKQGKSLSSDEKDYLKKYIEAIMKNRGSSSVPSTVPSNYPPSETDRSDSTAFYVLGMFLLFFILNSQSRKGK